MDLTGSIKILERGGDPFTIRELRDMAESRSFKRFIQRIDLMIETERQHLENSIDNDSMRRSQGALKALRIVRELPSILEQEMVTSTRRATGL